MGNGKSLVPHNVKQCDSYTDNAIVVSHLLLGSNWTATLDGVLVSPGALTYQLGRLDGTELGRFDGTEPVGLKYDERQRARVRTLVVTDGFEVTRGHVLGNSYNHRPNRAPLRTLGFAPLVASALPPRLLFDIVLSGLQVDQVINFLKHHISDDDGIVVAQ